MTHKKNILLVSSAFYPELSPRSFRATELAREFYRQGHQVTVITKNRDYDYSGFLKEFSIALKMYRESVFPRIPETIKGPFSPVARIMSRVLSVLFEYPAIEEMFLVHKMLKDENGYDLMISFAVPFPVHWGVARITSGKNSVSKTWIADCGDPYMFARLDRFRKPFYFKLQETRFCRRCDYITIPFDNMRNQFYQEFRSKIRVIPQGFNMADIVLHEGPHLNERPVFIFAGSIIPGKRDLALLLDFLALLPKDFLFIIYTNQRDWFAKYTNILGGKLLINDYIDRLSLIFEMSKADFLVNVDTIHDDHSNVEAVPSKLIDYALSNRPILNIHSAHLDKELVLEFLERNYSRQRKVEKSQFDIRSVTAKFLALSGENNI